MYSFVRLHIGATMASKKGEKFLDVVLDKDGKLRLIWHCITCKEDQPRVATPWFCDNCEFAVCQECLKSKVIWNYEANSWWCYKCCESYESVTTTDYQGNYFPPSDKDHERLDTSQSDTNL